MQIGFPTGDNRTCYEAICQLEQGLQGFQFKAAETSPHFTYYDLGFRELHKF